MSHRPVARVLSGALLALACGCGTAPGEPALEGDPAALAVTGSLAVTHAALWGDFGDVTGLRHHASWVDARATHEGPVVEVGVTTPAGAAMAMWLGVPGATHPRGAAASRVVVCSGAVRDRWQVDADVEDLAVEIVEDGDVVTMSFIGDVYEYRSLGLPDSDAWALATPAQRAAIPLTTVRGTVSYVAR